MIAPQRSPSHGRPSGCTRHARSSAELGRRARGTDQMSTSTGWSRSRRPSRRWPPRGQTGRRDGEVGERCDTQQAERRPSTAARPCRRHALLGRSSMSSPFAWLRLCRRDETSSSSSSSLMALPLCGDRNTPHATSPPKVAWLAYAAAEPGSTFRKLPRSCGSSPLYDPRSRPIVHEG